MKKALSKVGAIMMGLLVVIGMFAAIWYATSAEMWYAGQYMSECDSTE